MLNFAMLSKTLLFSAIVFYLFSCKQPRDKQIEENVACAEFSPLVHKKMHDWGKLFQTEVSFCESFPKTEGELQRLLQTADSKNISVRIRGRGHSMNGSTLPRQGELLIVTENLRQYNWQSKEFIRVGGGISIYALQQWLKARGFSLPVFTDVLGPSVGGYISASGISLDSQKYGGFWNNVNRVRLVDAKGEMYVLTPKDKDFKWLFGSMGQLGVIVEADLKIVPYKKPRFRQEIGIIAESLVAGPKGQPRDTEYESSHLVWFTVIAPIEKKSELMTDLLNIKAKYSDAINYIPEYIWPVRKLNFTPPLFYPENRELICIGIWGMPKSDNLNNNKFLFGISEDISNLITQKKYYRRYIQSEVYKTKIDWREYWGEKIYSEFLQITKLYNPKGNLNQNCIFGCDSTYIEPSTMP
ncbi:MAG TPA: FAD-binding oxidoreductase [Turneriella sp.]|nr:FAD-binding oxidoreductase [Turneriella sp.]